jgi:hypothetical protein
MHAAVVVILSEDERKITNEENAFNSRAAREKTRKLEDESTRSLLQWRFLFGGGLLLMIIYEQQ